MKILCADIVSVGLFYDVLTLFFNYKSLLLQESQNSSWRLVRLLPYEGYEKNRDNRRTRKGIDTGNGLFSDHMVRMSLPVYDKLSDCNSL